MLKLKWLFKLKENEGICRECLVLTQNNNKKKKLFLLYRKNVVLNIIVLNFNLGFNENFFQKKGFHSKEILREGLRRWYFIPKKTCNYNSCNTTETYDYRSFIQFSLERFWFFEKNFEESIVC